MKETAEADLSGSIAEELDGLVSSNMVASFVMTTCTAVPFAMLCLLDPLHFSVHCHRTKQARVKCIRRSQA